MLLSYDVAGGGPPVVLLHAGVCDRRMWDPQWSALIDAGYRVVRCDFRGFGQSPVPPHLFNDAEDVLALLDLLSIGRAALIASSYGGKVALQIAARWPQRSTALALLCTAVPEHHPSPELRAFDAREEALLDAGDIAGAVELNVATWLGPDADAEMREAVRRMQRRAFELQLAADDAPGRRQVEFDLSAISAPVLAVSGEHDLPDFRQIAARLPDQLAHARHLELSGAGHLPNLERPVETTAALIAFLRKTIPAN
ncbi:alpha/beta fold hydrolase [Nocardia sp. NPDC051321]|uniref:alpha/beta fold hydrolase n=1 Tax=Nocardia sp. NPDC051321 TaxID=3364323 RepID=UPI0037B1975C